ncbi:MAG: SDR family NAD(P)-dependent oxidoreductase [Pseudomonadota bacterium]
MDLGLADQVVLVTGAARGIGAATCELLASEGCQMAMCDRDLPAAQDAAARIRAQGGRALAFEGDVSRKESVTSMVRAVLDRLGTVHVLVNNAGFSRDRAILEMSEDDWDVMMNVCLKGTFLCSQAVLPSMLRQGYGRIVNVASRAHLGGEPLKTAYSAAKGGVVSFTKALSVEVGKQGITVNAVAPGFTRTERLESLPNFADIQARASSSVHTARLGTPADMAAAIAYLASSGAGFVTGEVLYVTGGRYG